MAIFASMVVTWVQTEAGVQVTVDTVHLPALRHTSPETGEKNLFLVKYAAGYLVKSRAGVPI